MHHAIVWRTVSKLTLDLLMEMFNVLNRRIQLCIARDKVIYQGFDNKCMKGDHIHLCKPNTGKVALRKIAPEACDLWTPVFFTPITTTFLTTLFSSSVSLPVHGLSLFSLSVFTLHVSCLKRKYLYVKSKPFTIKVRCQTYLYTYLYTYLLIYMYLNKFISEIWLYAPISFGLLIWNVLYIYIYIV